MVYHFLMTKSTDDATLLKGRVYTTKEMYGIYRIEDEDGGTITDDDINVIADKIREKGGEFTLHKFDKEVDICIRCNKEGDGSVFKLGNVYLFHMDKYDHAAEEPFTNCFEGTILKREHLVNDFDDSATSPRFFVRNIIKAMNGELSFSVCDSEEYYKTLCEKEEAEYQAKTFEKYKLTAGEYEKVKAAVIEVLEDYNHPWTDAGVDALLDEWMENKGEMISAFMSHPNYNGNFQLVFSNETYTSECSKTAGYNFINWVWDNFRRDSLLKEKEIMGKTMAQWERVKNYLNATLPLVVPMMEGDNMVLLNYDLFERRRREIERIAFTIQLFNGKKYTEESIAERDACSGILDKIYGYQTDRVNAELAEYINKRLPKIRAREGQKTTKVVGKIAKHYGIDLINGYVKKFTDYCDAINVIKITRHTIISVHPVDYLTMSFGNSWSSCHTIDKENKRNMPNGYEGLHASGTVSYMLDGCSVVMYTVKKEYEGNTFYEMPKINRCMFHAAEERIVQGRCYPQEEDENDSLYTQFRVLAQKVFSEIWGIPNMWRLNRNNFRNMIRSLGTHYPDYSNFSSPNMSIFKYTAISNKDRMIEIGHNPICTVCGEEHTSTKKLSCCNRICPQCGAYIEDDDLENAIRVDGQMYHEDCVFYCAYHDRYEPADEKYCYVTDYGDICGDAWEYGDFYCCDCCNEYFAGSPHCDYAGDYVCDGCLENHYAYVAALDAYYPNDDIVYCDQCGETLHVDNANFNEEDSCYYCDRCYEEIEETAEAV